MAEWKPSADDIETWLRSASSEEVLAVHDLAHAVMSERWQMGKAPSSRKLKMSRTVIDGAGASPAARKTDASHHPLPRGTRQ